MKNENIKLKDELKDEKAILATGPVVKPAGTRKRETNIRSQVDQVDSSVSNVEVEGPILQFEIFIFHFSIEPPCHFDALPRATLGGFSLRPVTG